MSVTLVLGEAKLFALPAIVGQVRKVLVPAGTREIRMASRETFFRQTGVPQSTLDEADEDPEKQFPYFGPFGMADKLKGFGKGAGESLEQDTFYFFVGTVADQVVWMEPVGETT